MVKAAMKAVEGPASPASTISFPKRKRANEQKFYAVRVGKIPGIYHTWVDCQNQITGHKQAKYKSFTSLTQAEAFLRGENVLDPSAKPKFYAVRHGHTPGIYTNWEKTQAQTTNFKRPKFKSFSTNTEAEEWLRAPSPSPPPAKKLRLSTSPTSPTYTDSSNSTLNTTSIPIATSDLPPTSYPHEPTADAPNSHPHPSIEGSGESGSRSAKQWIKVWTDGACPSNGKTGARAGVGVWFGDNDPRNISERLSGKQTNQRAELVAILRALQAVSPHTHIIVHTDSKFAIDCLTNWFRKWETNGWRNAAGQPVEHKLIIEPILRLSRARDAMGSRTKYEWVKGHSGDKGNDGADFLASSAANKPQKPDIES